jgi:hypothetical protein
MDAVAVVTLVIVAVTVVVLAGYLITVAVLLRIVNARLATVISALEEVAERANAVGPAVTEIDRRLAGARVVLEDGRTAEPSAAATGAGESAGPGTPRTGEMPPTQPGPGEPRRE